MEEKKFEAVLVLLVPQIVYSLLEKEETKLWHLSAPALFELYDEEVRTGSITFPEEV